MGDRMNDPDDFGFCARHQIVHDRENGCGLCWHEADKQANELYRRDRAAALAEDNDDYRRELSREQEG